MLASMSEPRADTPPLNWSDLGVVATSREPIGVAGEMTFVVPSLLLSDEAIELFTDRARHARPDFDITGDGAAVVTEICRRLDGMRSTRSSTACTTGSAC